MYIPGYFKVFETLQNYQDSNQNKYMILEPMCSILRLILYIYKDKGTKISISNNSIQYNDPSLIQGLIRNLNGDKKDDLHNLYHPFLKSFEWYDKNNEIYNYFYKQCIIGLQLLLNIYEKNSIIHHTITHYIHLFTNYLDNKTIQKYESIKESPLLNDLQNIWDEKELNVIYNLFQLVRKSSEKEKIVYLKSIDDIITLKEENVYNYINKYSTSYN